MTRLTVAAILISTVLAFTACCPVQSTAVKDPYASLRLVEAAKTSLNNPHGIAFDNAGNMYIADTDNNLIRKVDKEGFITTLEAPHYQAEKEARGESQYLSTVLYNPEDIAVDSSGNIYIADSLNNMISKIDANGNYTPIAGLNYFVSPSKYSGDGGPALYAELNSPEGVVVDSQGNIYIGDGGNSRVRKIDLNGIISTVAGDGSKGSSGDGGPATLAAIGWVKDIALDSGGNLYIACGDNIRKVDKAGIISTILYSGTIDHLWISDIDVDSSGNIYLADFGNHCVRVLTRHDILTLALVENSSTTKLNNGTEYKKSRFYIALDNKDALYFSLPTSHTVMRLETAGRMTVPMNRISRPDLVRTITVNEVHVEYPYNQQSWPGYVDRFGQIHFQSADNNDVREAVQRRSRLLRLGSDNSYARIAVVAGNGTPDYKDPATIVEPCTGLTLADLTKPVERNLNPTKLDSLKLLSTIEYPSGFAMDKNGNSYIVDGRKFRIVKLDKDGRAYVIAGNGLQGYCGDGGDALRARLGEPKDAALDSEGNLYFIDGNTIRMVDTDGVITTFAGGLHKDALKERGADPALVPLGDGGPAAFALLNRPSDIKMDTRGNLYIADTNNHRIRVIDKKGIINTVAGDGFMTKEKHYGRYEYVGRIAGDGGQATLASLNFPVAVSLDMLGNMFIADKENGRIRKVGNNGIITTVAGGGKFEDFEAHPEYKGGLPSALDLRFKPTSVTVDDDGNLYTTEYQECRILKIEPSGRTRNIADVRNGMESSLSYIVDQGVFHLGYQSVWRMDGDGRMSLFAGGEFRESKIVNGTQATKATMRIGGFAVDPAGNIFIAEDLGTPYKVWKVGPGGWLLGYAGCGCGGIVEENVRAIETCLKRPKQLACDRSGNLYLTDGRLIRMVDGKGIISTVAGREESEGISGDGGPATAAKISGGGSMYFSPAGELYMNGGDRVRKIDAKGTISSVIVRSGDCFKKADQIVDKDRRADRLYMDGISRYYPGDQRRPVVPVGSMAVDKAGNIYIIDGGCIYRIDPEYNCTLIAGIKGKSGFTSDGPGATAAFRDPVDIEVNSLGEVFVTDTGNFRIRKITADGIVSTVVGRGSCGYTGDGGPATEARLIKPVGIQFDAMDNMYIQDDNLIRKVDTKGMISTVAGMPEEPR
ncbi:MAG: hypothetical protein HZA22_10815 [Nitrospirae bacterium]|nr:hypothetical protein [Nitrospirota bacterium]